MGVAAVVAATTARPAVAQTAGNEARAESLFNAAQALRDGGQLREACPMFAESKRLSSGVGVTLYLADCYERAGKPASALEQFREAEALARSQRDEKRATLAHTHVQALEAKVGYLQLVVGSGSYAGWEVRIDDRPVAPEHWGDTVAVDPGDHVVSVHAPGRPLRTLSARVDAAAPAATITIDEGDSAATPAPASPSANGASGSTPLSPAEPAPLSGPGNTRLWVELGLVGVGAAGLGLGTGWLIKRNASLNSTNVCSPPPDVSEVSAASSIAYAVGGVALASAVVVYLTAPRHDHVGLAIAPALVAGGGGATVRGSF